MQTENCSAPTLTLSIKSANLSSANCAPKFYRAPTHRRALLPPQPVRNEREGGKGEGLLGGWGR